MRTVVGDNLPVALGVAISPVPIIAVILILMLLAPRANAASLGFLLGWVVGISVVTIAVALLVDPVDDSDSGGSSTAVAVVQLTDHNAAVMSVLLLVIGVAILGKGLGAL